MFLVPLKFSKFGFSLSNFEIHHFWSPMWLRQHFIERKKVVQNSAWKIRDTFQNQRDKKQTIFFRTKAELCRFQSNQKHILFINVSIHALPFVTSMHHTNQYSRNQFGGNDAILPHKGTGQKTPSRLGQRSKGRPQGSHEPQGRF